MYNQQWISFAVVILANVLPSIGVSVGSDQLTAFVQVGLSVAFGIWGIIAGYKSGVHTLGGRSL
jgi:hypothetical protein